MKIIAVGGAKGGTGKTTTALSLAHMLVRAGWRVVLRDLDPQASATLALGQAPVASPWTAPPIEVAGLLLYRGGRSIEHGIHPHTELPLPQVDCDALILDTPPTLGPLPLSAFRASDLVLVPLRPSALDLPALTDVAAIIDKMDDPPLLRALLTQTHVRRTLTEDVAAHIQESRPKVLYTTRIPEDVRAAEAPGFGLPVTLHAPRSRAAEAYWSLAVQVVADLNGGAS